MNENPRRPESWMRFETVPATDKNCRFLSAKLKLTERKK
jgi:hypothetical protein